MLIIKLQLTHPSVQIRFRWMGLYMLGDSCSLCSKWSSPRAQKLEVKSELEVNIIDLHRVAFFSTPIYFDSMEHFLPCCWEVCLLNWELSGICSHSVLSIPSWGLARKYQDCMWTLLDWNTSVLIGNMPVLSDVFIAIQCSSVRTVTIVTVQVHKCYCFFVWILW